MSSIKIRASPVRPRAALCLMFFLLAALALIAVPAWSAERVSIPASQKWRGKAFVLKAALYRPGGVKRAPVVILMHGCGGLGTSVRGSLRSHAKHLAANGFASLILDSFGPRRVSGGWVCEGLDRLVDARHYRLRDAQDASDWLKQQPGVDAGNIFLMGQSNGGSVALRAAAAGGFRAVAAYYPWCGAASGNRAPLIVFGGGLDDWVPPDDCGKRPQSAKYDFVLYPEATHSFDVRTISRTYLGHRIGYHASATADSRQRMVAFFRQHMR